MVKREGKREEIGEINYWCRLSELSLATWLDITAW